MKDNQYQGSPWISHSFKERKGNVYFISDVLVHLCFVNRKIELPLLTLSSTLDAILYGTFSILVIKHYFI